MRAVLAEIAGLFVDDGFLALALVAWCVAVGLGASLLPALLPASGPILFVGCAVILLATVIRAARQR